MLTNEDTRDNILKLIRNKRKFEKNHKKNKTKKFTMKTTSGISNEGIYEWDITSLTLMYDDKVERYGFKLAIGTEYEYIIQVDRTPKYQLKYPDAGITEVTVNRAWKDNGIIIE